MKASDASALIAAISSGLVLAAGRRDPIVLFAREELLLAARAKRPARHTLSFCGEKDGPVEILLRPYKAQHHHQARRTVRVELER